MLVDSYGRINALLVMNHDNEVNTFKPPTRIRSRKTLDHGAGCRSSLLLAGPSGNLLPHVRGYHIRARPSTEYLDGVL